MPERHGPIPSQVGSAKKLMALHRMPVTLQLSSTCFESHVQLLAQSGCRDLIAAPQCLERINPLSSTLFCFLLMRIDAYPCPQVLQMPILALWIMKGELGIFLKKFYRSNKTTVLARCSKRLVLAGKKSCSCGHSACRVSTSSTHAI